MQSAHDKAMPPSRWRSDALFQCRCSGIGIMHGDATGLDALLLRFCANYPNDAMTQQHRVDPPSLRGIVTADFEQFCAKPAPSR